MKAYTGLRILLFTTPVFLAPFIETLGKILMEDVWPSPQKFVICGLIGLSSACITARAYLDSSYSRAKAANETKQSENPPTATP